MSHSKFLNVVTKQVHNRERESREPFIDSTVLFVPVDNNDKPDYKKIFSFLLKIFPEEERLTLYVDTRKATTYIRDLLVWIMYKHLGLTFEEIGEAVGRDHSTVVYMMKRFKKIYFNPMFKEEKKIHKLFKQAEEKILEIIRPEKKI